MRRILHFPLLMWVRRNLSEGENTGIEESNDPLINLASTDLKEPKEFRHFFEDTSQGRCSLCNETLSWGGYGAHVSSYGHMGRVVFLEKVISGFFGQPAQVLQNCWSRLDVPCQFDRIQKLSSSDIRQQRARVIWLLKLLKQVGVLSSALSTV